DFDSLVTQFVREMYPGSYPINWLKKIRTIETSYNLTCPMTCVRPLARGSFQIEIHNGDLNMPFHWLASLSSKELFAGDVVLDVFYNKHVIGRDEAGSHASTIAEMLSFAWQAYICETTGYHKDSVPDFVKNAWKGGFVFK
ncbi:MAG: hypothetical protein N2559_06965, partial [Anaerolineae bacterium]|nr:hypothetical protein [Anaerolineae bacterium]